MDRRCIIVLGMHRSGTSALTGTLNLLGVELGTSLIPASPEVNAKGFWEHAPIVAIHERLLETLGSAWHDERPLPEEWWEQPDVQPFRQELLEMLQREFGSLPLWGLKDPRLCRLLPLWLPILQEFSCQPLFILIARHPDEVAASLERRDGFHMEKSHLLWLQHFLEAERNSRGQPRVLVTYDQLLADWRGTMSRVGKALSLPMNPGDLVTQAKIDAFLEPGLRHCHPLDQSVREEERLRQLAHSLYRLCGNTSDPDLLRPELETAARETAAITRLIAPWASRLLSLWPIRDELAATRERLADREKLVSLLQKEILRIKSTFSWQVTKPLRLLAFLSRRGCNTVSSDRPGIDEN